MKGEFKVGSVVLSNAGHDSGDYFVIVEIVDDEYVKVADGKVRLLAKPKLKKVKHLKLTGIELSELADKLVSGEIVHDKTVKTAIKQALKQ